MEAADLFVLLLLMLCYKELVLVNRYISWVAIGLVLVNRDGGVVES